MDIIWIQCISRQQIKPRLSSKYLRMITETKNERKNKILKINVFETVIIV